MTHQPMTHTLSQDVALECLDPSGRTTELAASLGYDTNDPFAVWITFSSPTGPVCWAMSREVLLLGLTDPAGGGDVEVWPSVDGMGRESVAFEFRSPDGRLIAQADTNDVQRFLTLTLAAVPAGTEGDHLDIDAIVDGLLGRSDAQ